MTRSGQDGPQGSGEGLCGPLPMRGRRRERCARCHYPLELCPCGQLTAVATRTRVVVVSHYVELQKSTNTARLAAIALSSCEVRGRGSPEARAPMPWPRGRRIVLFPGHGARPLTPEDASDDLVLLVPDGTWTQAARIARRESSMQSAERVALPGERTSRYALRRNEREGGLCTIEAIAVALGILEGPWVETHLLAAFDAFQARALALRNGGARRDVVPERTVAR